MYIRPPLASCSASTSSVAGRRCHLPCGRSGRSSYASASASSTLYVLAFPVVGIDLQSSSALVRQNSSWLSKKSLSASSFKELDSAELCILTHALKSLIFLQTDKNTQFATFTTCTALHVYSRRRTQDATPDVDDVVDARGTFQSSLGHVCRFQVLLYADWIPSYNP